MPSGSDEQKLRTVWVRLKRSRKDLPQQPVEPDHVPEGWEEKGDVLYEAGKTSEAIECYTRGLNEEPKRIDLWMKKAGLFIEEKRYRSGLFCIEKALALDDSLPEGWLLRGYLLHKAGDNEGAIESIDFCLSLRGDNPDAWMTKCSCLMMMERYDEAKDCITYVHNLDADETELEALIKDLRTRVEAGKSCPVCNKRTEEGSCPECSTKYLIEDARISIAAAREASVDITEAEEILAEAKDMHAKGFTSPAMKALRPLRDLLGDHWKDSAYALSLVDEAEEIAETLEADNMRGTLSIREKTGQVREQIGLGRPVQAVVKARAALEHANKIAKKYSEVLLSVPKEQRRPEVPAEGKCPGCGEEVEDEWVKCPVCKGDLKGGSADGAKAATEDAASTAQDGAGPGPAAAGQPTPAQDGVLYCPKCGEEIEDHWVRCLFCSAPLIGKGGGG
jgi:tetratricopeptide (TPR) repeat protein/uncharacterized protein YbaR (Trm112 family)